MSRGAVDIAMHRALPVRCMAGSFFLRDRSVLRPWLSCSLRLLAHILDADLEAIIADIAADEIEDVALGVA